MEVVICPNADEVARVAATKIARVCRDTGPRVVLGVATGSSPVATYDRLADMVLAGEMDLGHASAFALDEYVGLPPGHPESYAEVIRRTVTEPLRMDPELVHAPDGFSTDVEAAAEVYEADIRRAGGIDIQLVGVGANGHVGFNEPSSSLSSRTRIKTLTQRTRLDNQRFFNSLEEVPYHCLTQGLGTIMDAKEVLLVAQGDNKAEAIAGVVEGPITARCPGSVLQWHRRATVVIDEAAAAGLQLTDYYRHTYDHKPLWQRYDVVEPT